MQYKMNNLEKDILHLLEQNETYQNINVELEQTLTKIDEINTLLLEYNDLLTEKTKLENQSNLLQKKKAMI